MTISAPGRVNLIGEHIDYHNLSVLPMAIDRRVRIEFEPRADSLISARSAQYGAREFAWTPELKPSEPGDWVNYLKAAAQAVGLRWGPGRGIDAEIRSDLPAAAGLSSSSALLTGFALALLRANGIRATFEELMSILPDGEQFVGTRGGGMDHAAVLAARRGCALLVDFAPLAVTHVPVPAHWTFLVAHSLTTAEKSGAVRAEFNERRAAGAAALAKHGIGLDDREQAAFLHVTSEAKRVTDAVVAMRANDIDAFGRLLDASHASLRDLLRVSCPALDRLVEAARSAGAVGARLTGAGFGGCAVILCRASDAERVREGIIRHYYRGCPDFDPANHLIFARPAAGALRDQ